MSERQALDFLVFAAPKCATTSLHEALYSHPKIEVPRDKELPFFCDDRMFKQGLPHLETFFSKPNSFRGTISPQYAVGKDVSRTETADRIADLLPDVKLVALFRHPVKRAYSHHKMLVSRNHETRSFTEAIEDVKAGKPNLPSYPDPDMDYVMGSSYGSLLDLYYARFNKSQIKVLYTEELIANPTAVVSELVSWLGLDQLEYEIDLTKARTGGSKPKVGALTPGKIFAVPGVKKAWSQLPTKLTKPVEYRINLWNTKPDDDSLDPQSEIYAEMVDLLSDEVARLRELTGTPNPWGDWD